MRRRGSMLEMRGAQSGGGSLSGSDNSINSSGPARRSTVTRRSFGDPPPLPGKKAVIVNPLNRSGIPTVAAVPSRAAPSAAAPTTTTFAASAAASATATPTRSSPTTPPATGGPPAPFSRVTIVHRPTKEARKAEIVAAVTKRLYTQKKKPEPGSGGAAWVGPWPGAGVRPGEYPGGPGGTMGGALPDTSEEAEDEPKELKLCSNARAKLQEISKRALALHLHRKRRDQEAQTEAPGVLRVKEKASGPDGVATADKACQHPHSFYLQPFWALAPGLESLWGLTPALPPGLFGQQSHAADDAFSDDSLEPSSPAPGPDRDSPPCGTLLQAFTLRSGGRFEAPAPRLTPHPAPAPRTASHACQTSGASDTATPTRTADVATSIACDASTMTPGEEEDATGAMRDAETMTSGNNDKATMTVQSVEVAVMTLPEEAAFKDAGTTTSEEQAATAGRRDCCTETERRGPDPRDQSLDVDGRGQRTVQCDVRLSYQGSPMSPACSYRLTVPSAAVPPPPQASPNVLSAGQHIPSGATDDRPAVGGNLRVPGSRGSQGGPGPGPEPGSGPRPGAVDLHKAAPSPLHARDGSTSPLHARDGSTAPPDIIAEAGSSPGASAGLAKGIVAETLSAVVSLPAGVASPQLQQQVFSLEIIRPVQPLFLDAHPQPEANTASSATARSRSIDGSIDDPHLEHTTAPVHSPGTAPEPKSTCLAQEPACPPKRFRLPCLADGKSGSAPRPSATARPVDSAVSAAETPAAAVRASPGAKTTLTAKQRRLLVNLLNVRPERRRRPSPATTQRRRPPPVVPSVDRQAVMQSLSCLLGEAALYVRSARNDLSKAQPPDPPPAPAVPPPATPTPEKPTTQTSGTQTTQGGGTKRTSDQATQSIADAAAQCSLLSAREVPQRTRASQCALPTRATASASTQCSPLGLRAWEDGDLTWASAGGEDDLARPLLPPPRKAESMADLYDPACGRPGGGASLPWRSRGGCSFSLRPLSRPVSGAARWVAGPPRPPELWARCPRRPLPPCVYADHRPAHPTRLGLCSVAPAAPTLSSPKQYLHHLVTLRRGVVLASMETEWRERLDGRPIFPS